MDEPSQRSGSPTGTMSTDTIVSGRMKRPLKNGQPSDSSERCFTASRAYSRAFSGSLKEPMGTRSPSLKRSDTSYESAEETSSEDCSGAASSSATSLKVCSGGGSSTTSATTGASVGSAGAGSSWTSSGSTSATCCASG